MGKASHPLATVPQPVPEEPPHHEQIPRAPSTHSTAAQYIEPSARSLNLTMLRYQAIFELHKIYEALHPDTLNESPPTSLTPSAILDPETTNKHIASSYEILILKIYPHPPRSEEFQPVPCPPDVHLLSTGGLYEPVRRRHTHRQTAQTHVLTTSNR